MSLECPYWIRYFGIIGVYLIKNTITHKAYVGSTNDLLGRIGRHFGALKLNVHGNKYLQNSWNKHGEDAFTCEIINTFNTLEEARKFEQSYLNQHMAELYNINNLATGFASGQYNHWRKNKMSPETRKKISLANKGRPCHSNTKLIASLTHKNIPKSDAQKTKMSLSAKRSWDTPEKKEKRRKNMKGKRKKVKCPRCGIIGAGPNMWRYHFDKCTHSVALDETIKKIKETIDLNSIDFSKPGWVYKLQKLTGKTKRNVNERFVKTYFKIFYNERCFKRRKRSNANN